MPRGGTRPAPPARTQMTSRRHVVGIVASLLVVQTVACTEASEGERLITADNSSDLVGRLPGASIASPNAKPGATYLTARGIETLQAVLLTAGSA